MGRPFKPYQNPKLGIRPVDGLAFDTDRRWRIVATGQKFTEADPFKAIQRFYAMTGKPTAMTFVTVKRGHPDAVAEAVENLKLDRSETTDLMAVEHDDNGEDVAVGFNIVEDAQWQWVRDQIARDVDYAAKRLGVSPKALQRSIEDNSVVKLSTLLDAYKRLAKHEGTAAKTISKTESAWSDFVATTESATTEEITTAKLLAFRDWVNGQERWGTKSRGLIMQRVKAVVNAAASEGVNVGTFATDLKVLRTRATAVSTNPTPMTRETFRSLLDGKTTSPKMRAMLLCGLNFCMYLKEVCELRWGEIDMNGATMTCRRGKTKIIRAAVLWPETVEALKAIERRGETVFVSQRGTAYHVESARKLFADHRERCDIQPNPHTEWAAIRDAAYTTSSRAVLLQKAQVLAGHKVGALSDKYIARNPEYVGEACEAIRAAYIT